MKNGLSSCNHFVVRCINPYEIIRKYECEACGAVMMCACEEEFARRFLSHQLEEGAELETQRRVPVTLGFQRNVCNSCRGKPEEVHPMAETYGKSSKIKRYYWREIIFQTTELFANWSAKKGFEDYLMAMMDHEEEYRRFEKEVVEEIKELHKRSPKYMYNEEAQSTFLSRNKIEVLILEGKYSKTEGGKSNISYCGKEYSAEEFVAKHYFDQRYKVLITESIPFHVLFGTFMWPLIQDSTDPLVRIVSFGDRLAFEKGEEVYCSPLVTGAV